MTPTTSSTKTNPVGLETLAITYSCDKLYRHSYIPFYQQLFTSMRWNNETKKLLEIGIGYEQMMGQFVPKYVHGASLRMWRDYLPETSILACDIHENTLFQEERIATTWCDQSNPAALLDMVRLFRGNFDVVIDDGSHQHEDQLISAATLLPYMAPGGHYIIEDVWADKGEVLAKHFKGTLVRGEKTGDDNLVVVRV